MTTFVDLAANKQANEFRVEVESAMAERVAAALETRKAEVAAAMFGQNPVKEEVVTEKLAPNASASDYIEDFVKSDDPMFAGDSKKQRIKRALGAFYSSRRKRETQED